MLKRTCFILSVLFVTSGVVVAQEWWPLTVAKVSYWPVTEMRANYWPATTMVANYWPVTELVSKKDTEK